MAEDISKVVKNELANDGEGIEADGNVVKMEQQEKDESSNSGKVFTKTEPTADQQYLAESEPIKIEVEVDLAPYTTATDSAYSLGTTSLEQGSSGCNEDYGAIKEGDVRSENFGLPDSSGGDVHDTLETYVNDIAGGPNAEPYKCMECGKCFRTNGNLKNHMRYHGIKKPYECPMCNKCFYRSDHFECHVCVQSGEEAFRCSECAKCFKQNAQLQTHMRTHTGEKPFKCLECGQCYSQNSILKRHMLSHTGEKPFQCALCHKCFSRKDRLFNHRKTHLEKETVECPECKRSFRNNDQLKIHMRNHTGEKPFRCEECDRGFSQQVHLQNHRRYHD